MTLHKKHTHGRVFVGEEAREQLAIRKRDSHGDQIKMNYIPPSESAVLGNKDVVTSVEAVQTSVAVVYVTLPQTFSGPAVYSTLTDSPSSTDAPIAAAAVTSDPAATSAYVAPTSAIAVAPSSAAPVFSSSATQAAVVSSAATSAAAIIATASDASSVANTAITTAGPSIVAGPAVATTRYPSASASGTANFQNSSNSTSSVMDSSSNAGMSGGAKAGLAFGILFAFALVAGLAFFCWRRRRNPDGHEELVDEKHASFVDAQARSVESRNQMSMQNAARSASTAPRLSLRPVTQFLPMLSSEPAQTSGNTLAVAGAGMAANKSAWDRRPSNASNPFADSTAGAEKSRAQSPTQNPFDENEKAAGASSAKHTPKASLSGSEASGPSAGNAVAGAAPGPRGPNNVHRVQLDFKPSMDDELELRSGQLVRMLHEYDDGWALCIRMDRSQQGVAPRTCLSKLPVKPRPQGPPSGPNSRPGTPQGGPQPRRPSNAQGPPPANGVMYPRPLTPTQANRDRAPSVSSNQGSTSPNGGNLQRKPVPGQAL